MSTLKAHLTDQERDLLAAAEDFAGSYLATKAPLWDEERRMAPEGIREAAKIGLMGLETPEDLGGAGVRFSAKLAIIEALSRQCMAFTFSLINTQNIASRVATGGTPSQIDRYLNDLLSGNRFGATALTEPSAGSDFAAIEMSAKQVDGGWVLNGEKAWITNAAEADVFLVYAQTDPEKMWRGIASFLVDGRLEGFERLAPYALHGGHAMGVGGFRLSDFFVPQEDAVAAPGDAFKSAMAGVNSARTYVAGMCNAMVAASLACAVDYGSTRETFGKPLLKHQGVRWQLADVATHLEASRLLTSRAADLIDQGEDAMMAAAYAKKFGVESAEPGITACIQAMGANGMRREYPLGRHLACAKLAAYTDGSTEMQNERIGVNLEAHFRSDKS
jgi:alkylation response protein AidB-like acyl-CoA dehydrogenase